MQTELNYMHNEPITIFLIGINKEKTDVLNDIFDSNSDGIKTENIELSGLSEDVNNHADCLLIDFAILRNNPVNIRHYNLCKKNLLIPVIFTGELNDATVITDSFRNGADEYIPFPFRSDEVIARIYNQILLNRTKKSLEAEVEDRTAALINSNDLLNESVKEYRQILRELQENETLLLTLALNIPNSYLLIIEKNFNIGFAAGQEFKKSNQDPWRLIGLSIDRVFKSKAGFIKNNFIKTFAGEEISFELEFNNQYQLYKSVPLFNSDGAVPRILVVAENITEQKLSEFKIRESLQEKETLLKEIHHRVKNNMQLVCSMMNLQAGSIDNREASDIFKVLQSRMYSMSLVHEKLYQHKQFSKIDFREYIKELVNEIKSSFADDLDENHIKIELDLQDEYFSIEKAIPCGLILNELILNAFKHASHLSGGGRIKILFRKIGQDSHVLSVSDNGKGLPEGFIINKSESMGMMLVSELANQLKGEITVENDEETTFTIVFGETRLNKKSDFPGIDRNGNKNILIVEDERIISRMLRQIIEDHGYTIVDAVTSGRDAINSAARYNPDLIIMDIMLEDEIDGVEAATAIIKNHECPIVFLTGNSDPATLKLARDINPYHMLTKPVEKFQLIDVIESALR